MAAAIVRTREAHVLAGPRMYFAACVILTLRFVPKRDRADLLALVGEAGPPAVRLGGGGRRDRMDAIKACLQLLCLEGL